MTDAQAPSPADESLAADAGGVRGTRGFALLLGLLVFAAFGNVLLGTETFAIRDFGMFSFPVATFQRECFWKGELPFWNPFSCCGLPFLAQFNTLSLYPPALIYLLLPLTWALAFFCLAHLWFGGMGMYLLAARWTGSRDGAAVAGVLFAFNGLTLNFLMWPSHIATFAWIPWVIVLTEAAWRGGGRKIPLAAAAAALQVLAGGPESILFTWLILAALLAMECRTGPNRPAAVAARFLLTGFLALLLAAPQWLPFADLAMHSSRNSTYANAEWSMPAWGWANFLVPLFKTFSAQGTAMQHDQYWTTSYYCGIGAILLTVLAVWRGRSRRVWLLAGITAAALVLALGDHAYVYSWLHRLLPFLGAFRYPIKFVILTSALLPLLAAYGLSVYEKRPFRNEIVAAGVLAILAIAAMAADHRWGRLLPLFFLALYTGALWLFANCQEYRRLLVPALVAICWVDLITAVPWQNPTLHPSVYQAGLGRMSAKLNPEPDPSDSRVMMSSFAAHQLYYHPPPDLKTAYLLDRSIFMGDCNLLDNISKVDGFFSLYLRDTDKILRQLDQRNGVELSSLEDFLGVSQTIAPGKVYAWTPRSTYIPIVTCGQAPLFADETAALAAIGQTNVDFRKVTYLPAEARGIVTATAQPASRIVRHEIDNNNVTIEVESPGPAMVNVTQACYHNWRAFVDGRPVPLWRANYAFQAVEVPGGSHLVTIRYQDTLFKIGTALAAAGAAICVAMALYFKGKTGAADISC